MVKALQVLGPFTPKQFSGAGNDGALSTSMTAAIEALTDYDGAKIVSVEPIMVLGNVFLVVYQKP
jgi:hypothetical protein|tara:strand:- start:99 stop:293 length:195 start_codon:yes stop_codon:yes gene_type:complete